MFTACGIMHRRCIIPQNYRRKHVELIEIINKFLLVYLVGCLHYCINDARSHKYQMYSLCLGKYIGLMSMKIINNVTIKVTNFFKN